MNGIHDMGGMTCYGRVVREDNEPCFHAPWERRVFGMTMLALGRIDTLDAFRHAIERMDPIHSLSSTYYAHWLAALEMLAVEKSLLTPEELASGALRGTGGATEPPLPPEAVRAGGGAWGQPFQHVSDLAKLLPHLREPPYLA